MPPFLDVLVGLFSRPDKRSAIRHIAGWRHNCLIRPTVTILFYFLFFKDNQTHVYRHYQ
ncbi:Uncharacterised protein [Escherichia coli]|nr:Uncharacterised protein [Escherichia coli]